MHLNSFLFLFKLNKTNAYFHTIKTQKNKNEKMKSMKNVFFLHLKHHNAFDMRENVFFFSKEDTSDTLSKNEHLK